MAHDFLNKAFQGARFSVVHAYTKSIYEAHEKSCARISNFFSPANNKSEVPAKKDLPWLKEVSSCENGHK